MTDFIILFPFKASSPSLSFIINGFKIMNYNYGHFSDFFFFLLFFTFCHFEENVLLVLTLRANMPT